MNNTISHRKQNKKLKIKLFGLLEDYAVWDNYKFKVWDKQMRDRFWKDFIKLAEWYKATNK